VEEPGAARVVFVSCDTAMMGQLVKVSLQGEHHLTTFDYQTGTEYPASLTDILPN
jgi:hypothetical protein